MNKNASTLSIMSMKFTTTNGDHSDRHTPCRTNHEQQCTKKDWTPHDKGLVQSCKLELQGSTTSCSMIRQKIVCFASVAGV